MTRTLLVTAGMLITFELFLVDKQLTSGTDRLAQIKLSPEVALAADPALKYISEDSPYMRSER
jgi:hypothetical protein